MNKGSFAVAGAALLTIFAIFLVVPNLAEALRCGTELVSVDDTKEEVLALCGEPSKTGWYYGDEAWQYNFGPHRSIWVVRFRRKGTVKRLEPGRKVTFRP